MRNILRGILYKYQSYDISNEQQNAAVVKDSSLLLRRSRCVDLWQSVFDSASGAAHSAGRPPPVPAFIC